MTGSEDTHTREARKVKIIFIRILFFKSLYHYTLCNSLFLSQTTRAATRQPVTLMRAEMPRILLKKKQTPGDFENYSTRKCDKKIKINDTFKK